MKQSKNIGITGSNGFIGRHLRATLLQKGYSVVALKRSIEVCDLENIDIIINLAGASINRRWSKKSRALIFSSRIETTRKLVRAINASSKKPELLISGSAIGYYSSQSGGLEFVQTEYEHNIGTNFLANVCLAWESETKNLTEEVRLATTRFGLVMHQDGGALKKMIGLTKLRLTAQIGNGNQIISWISVSDLISAIIFIIENKSLCGAFNLTSPYPITNKQLCEKISNKYKTLKIIVPDCLINLVIGDAAQLLTHGQNVFPERLLENSFTFNDTEFIF